MSPGTAGSGVRRSAPDPDGFTLIELSVAMFIVLLVVASLTGTFLAGLSGTVLAKQRQTATGLATGVMEQFRAVDYGTLTAGLDCGDIAGDGRLAVTGTCGASGGSVTFTPGIGGLGAETVVAHGSSAGAVAPLEPHLTTRTIENAVYTIGAYVTSAANNAVNLTTIVTWKSSVSRGTRSVIQRSVEYSPSRCLSSATHPYAGACQAAFNGDAGLTKGSISVINPDDGSSAVPGTTGSRLDLDLPSLSGTLDSEQVSKLSASLVTSGASRTDGTGSLPTGLASAATSADNDPSTTSGGVGTAAVAQPSTSTLSIAGTGGQFLAGPTTSDSGLLDSRTSSTSSTCLDAAGLAMARANQNACSWGQVTPSGGGSGSVQLKLLNGAPNFTLASIAATATPSRAVVARMTSSGTGACPTTSGAGCVSAQSSRTLGTVLVGGLPTTGAGDTPPTGWGGNLLTLTGVAETATAEAGPGATTGNVSASRNGTLSYYDRVSGTVKNVSLSMLASNLSLNLGTVTGIYLAGGHVTVVAITGSAVAGAKTPLPTAAPTDATCKAAACGYSATLASTLTANLVYTVTVDGVQATRFALTVDLGSVLARAAYQAAFDA